MIVELKADYVNCDYVGFLDFGDFVSRKKIRVRCTLSNCPYANTTAVVHCVEWTPDGILIKCPFAKIVYLEEDC